MNKFIKEFIVRVIKKNIVEKRIGNAYETYMIKNADGETLFVVNNNWADGEYSVSLKEHMFCHAAQETSSKDDLQDVFDIIRASQQRTTTR